jgi:predicted enzyme related to lactoylglutathione lyase
MVTNIAGPDFITFLVSDLEASYRFYKEKIGLNESAEKRPNAHAFTTKPCGLAIRQSDKRKPERPGEGIILWLRSSDASILHDELKGRGVPIVEELRQSPFGMTFSFRDPDGYILTVHDGG